MVGRRYPSRTTKETPKYSAMRNVIARKPRKPRQSRADSDMARQASGVAHASSSTARSGAPARASSATDSTINVLVPPEPTPPRPTPNDNVDVPIANVNPPNAAAGPPRPSATTSEMTTLMRKRKLEELEAAEAIAKIQEEEEEREMEFEKKMFALQQKRLQRERLLVSRRMEVMEDDLNAGASSSLFSNVSMPSTTSSDIIGSKRMRSSDSDHQHHQSDIIDEDLETSMQNQTTNQFDQLAQAINRAVQMSTGVGSSEMKTFASRQVHRRDLSSFSGEPEEWPGFIAEFRSSNMECKFSNTENMARLKSSLRGKARDAVRSMLIVPDNVERVIETLEATFGHPELIVATLIKKVKRIPRPAEGNPESLLHLSNSVTNLVSIMQLLNQTGHLLNPQLISDLEEKLPAIPRASWAEAEVKVTGQVTLLEYSTWLQGFSKAMSRVCGSRLSSSSDDDSSSKRRHSGSDEAPSRHRESVFAITESTERPRTCIACDQVGHALEKCPVFQNLSVDSRWEVIKRHKVCFGCLNKGHQLKSCMKKRGRIQSPPACGVDGCRMAQHPLLHNSKLKRGPSTTDTVAFVSETHNTVLLKVVPVKIRGSLGEVSTHAFLDDGSTTTLLDRSTAEKIGATGPTTTLNLRWTNKKHQQKIEAQRVTIQIVGADGVVHQMDDVKAIPGMSLPIQFVDVAEIRSRWKYLQQVPSQQLEQGEPKILIGQAHWNLIQTEEYARGPTGAPALSRTRLGWALHGILQMAAAKTSSEKIFAHWQGVYEDDELHQLVKKSHTTEDFGVKIIAQLPRSQDDQRAIEIMKSTTRKIGKTWETGILWRDDRIVLPESMTMAKKRLFSIERRLDRDPHFANQYCSRMEEYVQKGYAKKLDLNGPTINNPKAWYLPHFAVVNPNKEKIRVVHDAAAKSHGKSLNDFVYSGPDLLRPLIAILFKFRQRAIAFGADIREMFPQIKIREEDRPAQRYLWRGMDRNREPDIYEFESVIFGGTASTYQAQEIKNRNALEFKGKFPKAVDAILLNHFMDDYWDSEDFVQDSIQLILDVIFIHSEGGFEMRNWICSSPEVLQAIPSHLRANCKSVEISDDKSQRVLGMYWNHELDVITFQLKFHRVPEDVVKGTRRPTKREVLKLVMSIFDPLGLIAHFTIRARILLQDIWREKIGWDDQISKKIFDKWLIWLHELAKVSSIRIPRCYNLKMSEATNISVHVFCDASEKAFAAVAYMRSQVGDEVQVRIIIGKTRVAPLRPLTIPRLELQAAVMGCRLAKTIMEEHTLPIQSVFFWSDSQTVLKWLRSDARRYNAFVAHRVGEIMEDTDIQNWNWIPSEENAADDATRDEPNTDLSQSNRWACAPAFLKLPPTEWPKEKSNLTEEQGVDVELKPEFLGLVLSGENPGLPDPSRFSKWSRLLRVTAWISRVFKVKKSPNSTFSKNLTVDEIENAETVWLRQIQQEEYPQELAQIRGNKSILSTSALLKLSPILDGNGLLRVDGRGKYSKELRMETKAPVILSPTHPLTRLIITHHHHLVNHHGQEQVVNELRQRYWITSLRAAVRSVWNNCNWCKIKRARPQPPEMAPLPSFRVDRPPRPFFHTGIDFFGPFEVKVRRAIEKRYGVIFVCLSTRAVHIEIASSLNTDSTLMAIDRFVELRRPEVLYSDNGTNLRGAAKEVKESLRLWDHEKIGNRLASRRIQWRFNPPAAPHMGGSWEALIKSIKSTLSSIMTSRRPTEEVLLTLFRQAQGIVNGHPLTHVPVDPDDLESLTPNHFLMGASSTGAPQVLVDSSLCLSRQYRLTQIMADMFWRRWVREYLPSLTRRTKWFKPTRSVQVGDQVIVADNTLERNHWPRGVVTAVHPGKDGVVRVVDVQTARGEYRRPLTKICLLDLHQE